MLPGPRRRTTRRRHLVAHVEALLVAVGHVQGSGAAVVTRKRLLIDGGQAIAAAGAREQVLVVLGLHGHHTIRSAAR